MGGVDEMGGRWGGGEGEVVLGVVAYRSETEGHLGKWKEVCGISEILRSVESGTGNEHSWILPLP